MTPLTILVAALVILIVDYIAERHLRSPKDAGEEEGHEAHTFDWLSNPLRRH